MEPYQLNDLQMIKFWFHSASGRLYGGGEKEPLRQKSVTYTDRDGHQLSAHTLVGGVVIS